MNETQLAKELSSLACEIRRKAAYMSMLPSDTKKWNYEQKQDVSAALNEVALKLETLIAKHYISAKLANNPSLLSAISRRCQDAIKREIRKNEVRQQYATLCRP